MEVVFKKDKMKKIIFIFALLILFLIFCSSFLYLTIPFLWLKSDEAFHKGRHDSAIKYLTLICFLQPHNSESYIIKAWLEWSDAKYLYLKGFPYEKKLNCAIKTYKKGQKNNPNNWQLYYEEGIMWKAFGENKKAEKLFFISSNMGAPIKKCQNK